MTPTAYWLWLSWASRSPQSKRWSVKTSFITGGTKCRKGTYSPLKNIATRKQFRQEAKPATGRSGFMSGPRLTQIRLATEASDVTYGAKSVQRSILSRHVHIGP